MGFLDGALRIMPAWELSVAGHPLALGVLIPGLVVPALFFTCLAALPAGGPADRRRAAAARAAAAQRQPTWRTAPRPAWPAVTFYGLLWAAAANDQIAYHLHLDLYTVTWIFRVLVLAGPALAFLLTRVICHALADRRRDEERHGRETGRIVMNPQGGYTEIREPAHRAAPPSADPPGPAASPPRSWKEARCHGQVELDRCRHAHRDPDCPVHGHSPAFHRCQPVRAQPRGRRLASADARKRIGAAGRKARPPKPGAHDAAPPDTCTSPAPASATTATPAETRRWVQEVPIVKKTAKLIYYTSDSWDRREAVVSPGCISREQFETDTRCHDNCPRDIAAGLVCAPHGRGHRHCVHVLAPGRHCHAPGGCGDDCPADTRGCAVRTARVHVGALPARGRPVPSRIPGRRDPDSR